MRFSIPTRLPFRLNQNRAPRPPRVAQFGCERLEGRALLSSLTEDVQQLVTDLKSLHQGSGVTPAEIQAVNADFKAIAAVATRPSPATVTALETEIKVAVADGKISSAEATLLKKDATAVLVSANIPITLAQQTASDLKAVVLSSGITKADLKVVLGDVGAIISDLKGLKKS